MFREDSCCFKYFAEINNLLSRKISTLTAAD